MPEKQISAFMEENSWTEANSPFGGRLIIAGEYNEEPHFESDGWNRDDNVGSNYYDSDGSS